MRRKRHSSRAPRRTLTLLLRAIGILIAFSIVVNVLYHSHLPLVRPHEARLRQRYMQYHNDGLNHSLWSDKGGIQTVKQKGNELLHKKITAIKAEGGGDAQVSLEEVRIGREHFLALLKDAGVEEIDPTIVAKLPTWHQILDLYGEGPVVVGLEQSCQRFQMNFPGWDASIGTSGLFNTGTDPFAMYIQNNCYLPNNKSDRYKGMRWQVPWGKHTAPFLRLNNTAGHDHKVNKTNVMPIVLVRDPFSWMQSMCKHPYSGNLRWPHRKDHCPSLVPTVEDQKQFLELKDETTVSVTAMYPAQPVTWPSLIDMWSNWYRQYLEADYPRLMIRFEDLIFRQKELVSMVCDCAGAKPLREQFSYVVDAGKWGGPHQASSDLITAMIKYGSADHRLNGLTEDDLTYAHQHVDRELMDLFQYHIP